MLTTSLLKMQTKTESDLKVFSQFLFHKQENRNIHFIPPDQLNDYICEFLLSVTRKNGEEYEPTSLRSFVSSIDRHLKCSGSKISIMNDIDFTKCREVLKNKQKALKKQGLGNRPKAAEALTDEHLEKMYNTRTLGDYTPRSLIHSMWFICDTYFGMRTGTEIHNLQWGDISIGLDEGSGREFLQLCTERQTKTRTGANARDIRQNQHIAYAVPNDPAKDPVHLYRTYRDKRLAAMLHDNSPFFLSICTSRQSGWFKRTPMGISKLDNIMNEMKSDAGIDEARITPYSARKRMVQKLNDEGVPANQIVQISGHKNLNSLNNYSKLNSNQAMAISDILSNGKALTNHNSIPSSSNSKTTFPISRGFFINTNFYGSVTFNLNNKNEQNTLSQQHVVHRSPPINVSTYSSENLENESPVVRPAYTRIRFIPDSDSE